MLIEQTFQKLSDMRMHGFARALKEQLDGDAHAALAFDERLSMLVDREWNEREGRSLTRRLQLARLRDRTACVEDIDYRHPRGLDKQVMRRLAGTDWIAKHHNVLVTGKTGCGKTYLACALANKGCRDGYTSLYRRLPRLLHEISLARGDGSYTRLLARLAKTDLLVLDDWGLAPLGDQERRDVLEVLEDRAGVRSTVVAGQLPIKAWHKYIGEPTIADAVLDRLVHNAHRIELDGESLRKSRSDLTKEEPQGK